MAEHPHRPAWPETALGLGLVALAGVVAWQTAGMAVSPLYAKVGPRVFPYLAGAGLGLLGVALLIQGLRGGWQPADERAVAIDWRNLGLVAAGLLANAVLIVPLGFTLASAAMFVLIARGFGSRRPGRDALLALGFALASYFGFAKALGVNIGAGPLERLLGG